MGGIQKKSCWICGYAKHTDRCHIIPKFELRHIDGFQDLYSFESKNIIYLCKNHHWEYDHDLISDSDLAKIDDFARQDREFGERYERLICSTIYLEKGKKYSLKRIKALHKMNRWIKKTRARLKALGRIEEPCRT